MTWEDPGRPLPERAAALIDAAADRRRLKRLARWLDEADQALKRAVLDEGNRRGADLGPEAIEWPAKRLLRRAMAREATARIRRNPIARDEAFTCLHCGAAVSPHGRTARDHCPHCLWSIHVDEVPGDRAARCGALLQPIALDHRDGAYVLVYRCTGCGMERRNRVLTDGDPPDDWERVVALTGALP